jgi:protein transport protein SEC61 subunit beta
MVKAASDTSAGKAPTSRRAAAPRTVGNARRRQVGSSAKKSEMNVPENHGGELTSSADGSGFEVEPVPVLVFSVVFIVSVFMLHIWAKFSS